MVPSATAAPALALPLSITGPIDVGRLLRELEAIDNYLMQFHLKGQDDQAKMPKTSKLMDNLLEVNRVNLIEPTHRQLLIAFLQNTKDHAPVLHMSFGSDPSPAFLEKLVTWLRREIHPNVLVTVGLQPNIGAGCLVRSTNKYFDFSLRENFTKNRQLLMTNLREVITA